MLCITEFTLDTNELLWDLFISCQIEGILFSYKNVLPLKPANLLYNLQSCPLLGLQSIQESIQRRNTFW